MSTLIKAVKSKPLSLLLVFVPLALIAEVMQWDPLAIFIIAAIGVIPLAAYIGEATEALAVHTSPCAGALLNATLGNAAELIITIAVEAVVAPVHATSRNFTRKRPRSPATCGP